MPSRFGSVCSLNPLHHGWKDGLRHATSHPAAQTWNTGPDRRCCPARSAYQNLTKRLRPGEIAIIHHSDLDRVSAEALVEVGTSAVVNAVSSVSGRYPNLGPGILMEAGIPLIDNVGDHVFSRVHEGEWLTLDGNKLVNSAGSVIAEGTLFTTEILEDHLAYAREAPMDQIEAFAENTMTYLRVEKELLLEGVGVPDVVTVIEAGTC